MSPPFCHARVLEGALVLVLQGHLGPPPPVVGQTGQTHGQTAGQITAKRKGGAADKGGARGDTTAGAEKAEKKKGSAANAANKRAADEISADTHAGASQGDTQGPAGKKPRGKKTADKMAPIADTMAKSSANTPECSQLVGGVGGVKREGAGVGGCKVEEVGVNMVLKVDKTVKVSTAGKVDKVVKVDAAEAARRDARVDATARCFDHLCAVCLQEEVDENRMVRCATCSLTVHEFCCGEAADSDSKW
ncbi:hypothetical protein T484DRAFT_1778438 [Baffinella frigidus]|nr:hypothetical protein T484DRAFT_1778438 [Cryptophyta sp. CCMP2293]